MKNYEASSFSKVLSFGLQQLGFKIEGDTLTEFGILNREIQISEIEHISYQKLHVKKGANSYFYVLRDKSGEEFMLAYSLMEGEEYQKMLKEIFRINPDIQLSEEVKQFLEKEIIKKRLRFDFTVHKGDYFKRDQQLAQEHPTLDAIIGLTIVFLFLPIPLVAAIIGDGYLRDSFGHDYDSYRMWMLVLAGFAFAFTLTNILISLVSMYLGHKWTILSLLAAAAGVYFGLN